MIIVYNWFITYYILTTDWLLLAWLPIALDAHMFSRNGYGPGSKDHGPGSCGPGPGGPSSVGLGPRSRAHIHCG